MGARFVGATFTLIALLGCERERARSAPPSSEPTTDFDGGVVPREDSATAVVDVNVDETDVVEIFDFGPVDDVVFGGDGPVGDPTPGTLSFCTADRSKLSTLTLSPSSSLPGAFVGAWNSEIAKRKNGLLLLELRGLEGLATEVQLAVGAPDLSTPPTFSSEVPAPAVISAIVDPKTRRVFAARQDEDTILQLSSSTLRVGSIGLTATLDAKCEGATDVKLTLVIPVSAGATPFGGSTIGALLGPPNDVIAPDDAWRIELVGSAAHLGGS